MNIFRTFSNCWKKFLINLEIFLNVWKFFWICLEIFSKRLELFLNMFGNFSELLEKIPNRFGTYSMLPPHPTWLYCTLLLAFLEMLHNVQYKIHLHMYSEYTIATPALSSKSPACMYATLHHSSCKTACRLDYAGVWCVDSIRFCFGQPWAALGRSTVHIKLQRTR